VASRNSIGAHSRYSARTTCASSVRTCSYSRCPRRDFRDRARGRDCSRQSVGGGCGEGLRDQQNEEQLPQKRRLRSSMPDFLLEIGTEEIPAR